MGFTQHSVKENCNYGWVCDGRMGFLPINVYYFLNHLNS